MESALGSSSSSSETKNNGGDGDTQRVLDPVVANEDMDDAAIAGNPSGEKSLNTSHPHELSSPGARKRAGTKNCDDAQDDFPERPIDPYNDDPFSLTEDRLFRNVHPGLFDDGHSHGRLNNDSEPSTGINSAMTSPMLDAV